MERIWGLSCLAKTFGLLADIGESWEIVDCPEAQSVSKVLLRCAANVSKIRFILSSRLRVFPPERNPIQARPRTGGACIHRCISSTGKNGLSASVQDGN